MLRGISMMVLMLAMAMSTPVAAGPLRDLIAHRDAGDAGMDDEGGDAKSCAEWAAKVGRLEKLFAGRHRGPAPDMADVAYGPAARQRFDVFYAKPTPPANALAPVLVMVHGGGWCVGDKAGKGILDNKVSRWTPKGFVFISVNYPMVNDGSNAIAQAHDVARATAYIQQHAREWGGDPARVILMGHSAGAHLVSLVNADAAIRTAEGLKRLLGTISLDAGAIDVVTQMPHVYPFLKERYREAFGTTEPEWIAASPYHTLDATASPWLGVCSTERKDDPCAQARSYAEKSKGLGVRAEVLPEAKNHATINKELGAPGDYTQAVEAFMAGLDPVVAGLLR